MRRTTLTWQIALVLSWSLRIPGLCGVGADSLSMVVQLEPPRHRCILACVVSSEGWCAWVFRCTQRTIFWRCHGVPWTCVFLLCESPFRTRAYVLAHGSSGGFVHALRFISTVNQQLPEPSIDQLFGTVCSIITCFSLDSQGVFDVNPISSASVLPCGH